jgi:uncharacterized protein
VTGALLLAFRNASNRTLAIGALAGLVFPYAAREVWALTGIPFPERPEASGAGYLAENLAWVRYWYATAITLWPGSLPMFLFGLYMGRRHFFENAAAHRRTLRRVLVAGLAVGLLAYAAHAAVLVAWSGAPKLLLSLTMGLLWSAHAWGLGSFYAASVVLATENRTWRHRLGPLGAVGRMALTNYLLQATILVPVCLGFGLFDRVTPTLGLVMALAVWSVQVPASVWWLKRFRFGPAEWVWRSLTYGSPQPMRDAAPAELAPATISLAAGRFDR